MSGAEDEPPRIPHRPPALAFIVLDCADAASLFSPQIIITSLINQRKYHHESSYRPDWSRWSARRGEAESRETSGSVLAHTRQSLLMDYSL